MAAGVIGGTASRMGGGSFANGAQTSAFQYLFNEVGDAWNRKAIRDKVRITISEGEPFNVSQTGQWESGTSSSFSFIDLIPQRRLAAALSSIFTIDEFRTISNVEYQKYTVYRYDRVYDLVNGNVENINLYEGSKISLRSYSERTGKSEVVGVESRSCLFGVVGC